VARVATAWVPGIEIGPILAELKGRMAEELDYRLEARSQEKFAKGFDGDPHFLIPHVVKFGERVIVSEWIDGEPLSRIINEGTEEQRDLASQRYMEFLLVGPGRVGLLHADPHPGNFRLADDGRLIVLDYGAVNRLPNGLPAPIGPLLRLAVAGDAEGVYAGLQDEGFVRPGVGLDAERLLGYLSPILEPVRAEEFRFSRSWLRSQAVRIGDPRSPAYSTGIKLNLPPDYLLIHRVTAGAIGVLCQLEAAGHWRAELEAWLPGFEA
jgi:predicted unusual protein kinase regulating ubiquinone biosynthesis (AarF/ABC1/UbiB family)